MAAFPIFDEGAFVGKGRAVSFLDIYKKPGKWYNIPIMAL